MWSYFCIIIASDLSLYEFAAFILDWAAASFSTRRNRIGVPERKSVRREKQ